MSYANIREGLTLAYGVADEYESLRCYLVHDGIFVKVLCHAEGEVSRPCHSAYARYVSLLKRVCRA